MRRARWVGLAMAVGGGLFPWLGAAPAGATRRAWGSSTPCSSTSGATSQQFTKSVTIGGHSYTSDPGGLALDIGQTVSVRLYWAPSLFQGTPDQAWDCVYFGQPGTLGGTDLGPPYDTSEKPASADPFTTSFTAQATWSGKYVCDRGLVSGNTQGDSGNKNNNNGTTFKSNQFCFFVNPAARVPEAPWPALLAVPAIALGMGVVIVRRRRSAATA